MSLYGLYLCNLSTDSILHLHMERPYIGAVQVGLLSPVKRRDIGLSLSVCLSVCPSVRLSVPLDGRYLVESTSLLTHKARAFYYSYI